MKEVTLAEMQRINSSECSATMGHPCHSPSKGSGALTEERVGKLIGTRSWGRLDQSRPCFLDLVCLCMVICSNQAC